MCLWVVSPSPPVAAATPQMFHCLPSVCVAVFGCNLSAQRIARDVEECGCVLNYTRQGLNVSDDGETDNSPCRCIASSSVPHPLLVQPKTPPNIPPFVSRINNAEATVIPIPPHSPTSSHDLIWPYPCHRYICTGERHGNRSYTKEGQY